jgi:AcrR family transcriptional regulator
MDGDKRQLILDVALRHFADRGYAGTSVQDIVDEAKVAKPMVYYYFQSKAGLFLALIYGALDERFRVLSQAADYPGSFDKKLVAVLVALFKFIKEHRELVRLAFASTFAAPGELPPELQYKDQCRRSFEFFNNLIKAGQKTGDLSTDFDSQEITMAWYGLMNMYVMGQLFQPEILYTEETARSIVDLFFRGAGAKGKQKGPVRSR